LEVSASVANVSHLLPDGQKRRQRVPNSTPDRLRGIPPLSRLTDVSLTGAEQRLAEVLSRRYPEAALLSARNMADAAGTSPASVTRFARKLGYRDFAELQAELAVEMRARLNSPPKRLTVDVTGRRRPAGALLREVIIRERENLDATINMIDEVQLEVLARRLAGNTKSLVYVAGSKKAGIVAAYFAMQLAQLRHGVRLLSLSDALPDDLLDMSAKDLLIVFEPRRATEVLVQLLAEARHIGAEIAAFSDEHPPNVIATSDFLFRTKVDAISVFDSYAAMFALCDAVLTAIVQHLPNAVRARAERLEELNTRFASWHLQQNMSRPGLGGDL
jgi:DNA-binding MurR/RpiR family transcriptional regulator